MLGGREGYGLFSVLFGYWEINDLQRLRAATSVGFLSLWHRDGLHDSGWYLLFRLLTASSLYCRELYYVLCHVGSLSSRISESASMH